MEDVKLNRRDFLIASGIAAGGATALTSLQSCNSSDPFVPPDSEDDTCGKGNGDVPLYRAVGQALSDAGAGVVTTVPATDDVQIFDTYCEESGRTPFYSFNEEVAFTVAHAAALYGTRSATVIKSHGLAKASNSVVDALTCGTTAGLVVVSVNDMYGKGSETMFESLPFTRGLEIPMRKPCVRDIYREVQEAFEQSERMELPVVVYVEREQLNIGISVKRQTVDPPDHSFRRDGGIHILSPLLAEYQHEVRNAKRKGRDWRQIPRPQPPVIPDSLPEKWQPIVELYMPFFDALKSVRTGNSFVVSDTSVAVFFGYEPYECVDVSTYFGGSLPTAIGAQMGGAQDVWAVSGDFAFVGAGHMGLSEALGRGVPLKVVIMYNGQACTTGGHAIPEEVFERMIAGYEPFITRLPYTTDTEEIRSALLSLAEDDGLRILIAEFPGCETIPGMDVVPGIW